MKDFGDTDAMMLCMLAPGIEDDMTGKEIKGIPVCVWGPPGTGKSRIAAANTKALDKPAFPIPLAGKMPEHIGGMPIPTTYDIEDDEELRKAGVKSYKNAAWSRLVDCKKKKGVLILEDFSNASPTVQTAALNLVLEHRLDDLDLTDIPIVITANHHSPKHVMDPAMANRMVHLLFTRGPSSDAYKYRQEGRTSQLHLPVERMEEFNKEEVKEMYLSQARQLVADHIISSKRSAYAFDSSEIKEGALAAKAESETEGVPEVGLGDNPLKYAYPTDRSYEFLERILALCFFFDVPEAGMERMITGCVGQTQAKKIMQEYKGFKIPSVEELLSGKLDLAAFEPGTIIVAFRQAADFISKKEHVDKFSKAIELYFKAHPDYKDRMVPAFQILNRRMQLPSANTRALSTELGEPLIRVRDLLTGKQGLQID